MASKKWLVGLTLASLFSGGVLAGTMDDAAALLKQGKAAEAMALLDNDLPANAGDVQYNYLLGIASLDAGKPGNATFAFERALAIDPQQPLVRAELARALIALTEFEAARQELTQVRGMAVPADVAPRVATLLAALDKAIADQALADARPKRSWAGYVEMEAGYDTNINTATNSTSVFVPALNLPGSLTGFSTARASGLLGLNGGVSGIMNVAEDVDVYGNLDLKSRFHTSESDFALATVSAGVGVRVTRGKDQYSAGLTTFTYYIGQYRNTDQIGVYGQWQRELSVQDRVGVFGQFVQVDQPLAPVLNTNMYLLGGTWTHAYQALGAPVLSVIGFVGEDQDRNNNPQAGRTFFGAKVAGEYRYRDYKLFGSLALQQSTYGGTDPFFLVKREDTRTDLTMGASFQPQRDWTLTGQFIYTRNQSSIAFSDFDRQQLLFTARRDFY